MSTNFEHGLKNRGVPVEGARFTSPWNTHYFVDGDNGSDSNAGTEPTKALKTIQAAVTASTGGDVIYIRPKTYTLGTGFARYTEDVTVPIGTVGTTSTNALKSIIGVTSNVRPSDYGGVRWKFASATNLTVDAPALHIENIGFFSESATYAINFVWATANAKEGGVGPSVYNCAIKGAFIYNNGGDGLTIDSCRFQADYDGNVSGISLVGSNQTINRPSIRNCEFLGGNANNMSAACITGAAPIYDIVIRDCYFNAESDSGIYINLGASGNTGLIANCYYGSADIGATTTSIVGGGAVYCAQYDYQGLQANS